MYWKLLGKASAKENMANIEKIKKELEKRGKKGDKTRVSYLKNCIKEEEEKKESERDFKYIRELQKLIIKEIEEKPVDKYHLAYDSLGEGLEPIYFWTLDFMRDTAPSGLGLEVAKVTEEFEASVTSGYYGEMGSRAAIMQDRAMKMLQTINTVVKSIINLIYDLKEFKIRLANYDDLHSKDSVKREAGKLALKGIWMDLVDIKKGRASINMMAQQLQFVTLRDAFMIVKDEEDANKLDLNERVKRILKRKISEYLNWERESEQELRKRYEIERAYLKGQVDSLKLYTKWLRPYLKAAQKLGMKEFNTPDIVAAFSNMQMELSLFGKKEVKPEDVHERFKRVKLEKKIYSCVEIMFNFRTVPYATRGREGTHYIHTGKTEIHFRAFVLDEDEAKLFEQQELFEDMDLIENLTNVSLTQLQKDLDEFLKEPEKEEKPGKKFGTLKIFIEDIAKYPKEISAGFKEAVEPLGEAVKGFIPRAGAKEGFIVKEIKKYAEEKAKSLCYTAYDIYKKAHGMMTW